MTRTAALSVEINYVSPMRCDVGNNNERKNVVDKKTVVNHRKRLAKLGLRLTGLRVFSGLAMVECSG